MFNAPIWGWRNVPVKFLCWVEFLSFDLIRRFLFRMKNVCAWSKIQELVFPFGMYGGSIMFSNSGRKIALGEFGPGK